MTRLAEDNVPLCLDVCALFTGGFGIEAAHFDVDELNRHEDAFVKNAVEVVLAPYFELKTCGYLQWTAKPKQGWDWWQRQQVDNLVVRLTQRQMEWMDACAAIPRLKLPTACWADQLPGTLRELRSPAWHGHFPACCQGTRQHPPLNPQRIFWPPALAKQLRPLL